MKKYVGRLVDIAQWDDPPEYGIVIKEDDNFVPTLLSIFLFEDQKVISDYYTIEMVKFLEEQ